ncbi:sensor histidine kinase [Idiomarina xiamenensis]|uniref:histidine kinase n=1 Tax=Idiomarina xiamenensis 10-D-4 TaxID=740709 RepID=K2KYI4_9GAMM|nr:ATP-binding protein [Idiomarina xiamenensis]EKE87609.1 Signal transduction histidine kinase [Idiomarina xiamenensis 10-D-4]
MPTSSISRALLTRVLSAYFILTFLVTCIQIAGEYFDTKGMLVAELENQQHTFSGSLARSLWEFNNDQVEVIAEGLLSIPSIAGVIVRNDSGNVLIDIGSTYPLLDVPSQPSEGIMLGERDGVFGYFSTLVFEFSGQSTKVGDVTLFSTRDIAISRIKVSLGFIIGNAMIKSTFLLILFSLAFSRMLNKPMSDLTQQISNFRLDDLEHSRVHINGQPNNEFMLLEQAYNQLIDNIEDYQEDLQRTQQQLLHANRKLDEQNALLEQEVARKTSTLSQVMLDLEQRKNELEMRQDKLEREIGQRRDIESNLRQTNQRLENSLHNLQQAQAQLIESEKLASLGGLVAGITHDVNTPIGISVTASSFMRERLQQLSRALTEKSLTQQQLSSFINDCGESLTLLDNNLQRASDLISSFKQVAVDQTSDAIRDINLLQYLNEVVQSLQPHLKRTAHQVEVSCAEDLNIRCPAGAISQIFTNLIMNSLIHGFEGVEQGRITIVAEAGDGDIHFVYRDNGCGLNDEQMRQLFDPFFTTKRDAGGSGLGTHIIRNLITQSLGGDISAESEPGKGLIYRFSIPVTFLS